MKSKDKKGTTFNNYPNAEISRPYLKIEPFKQFQREAEIARRKNSSSLQVYELNKQRMRRIEAAYRNMSEKKLRTKSNERKSHPIGEGGFKAPFKPFNSITLTNQIPYKHNKQSNQTKRLFIKSKQKTENSTYQPHHHVLSLEFEKEIKYIKNKFEQLLLISSEKIFLEEFTLLTHECLNSREDEEKEKPLHSLIRIMSQCWKKINKVNRQKWQRERHQLIDSTAKLTEKMNKDAQIYEQMKKYCWNLELEVLKYKNKFFWDKEVQVCMKASVEDKGTNTEELQNRETLQLIKKVRQYEKREKQLLSVLYILKKDGIDIETAYEEVCRKQRQGFEQKSDEEEQECKSVSPSIKKHIKQNKKLQRKENSAYDADNSIIDDIDAISFNYQNQEPSMDAYEPKRVYKCANNLITKELKEKLKLDFNCMYEYEEQSNPHILSGNPSLPTV